jgi:hypothetical protein
VTGSAQGRTTAPGHASPRRNRVTPLGELVAVPERGLVYGNRGCLHDASGEICRRHAVRRWIACRLRFRDRRRPGLMMPGRYTELFFLDEATAMAAGHRACAECRRVDYDRLVEIWAALHPEDRGADAIDARLHGERVADGTTARRAQAPVRAASLPDGALVLGDEDAPWLVLGHELLRWTPAGYTARRRRPARGELTPLTPPSLVEVLRAGWEPVVPLLHPSARSRRPQRQLGSGS